MKIRSLKRVMAVVLTALLAVTAMPSGLTGLLSVKAAEPEITKTTTTYDFTKSGKWSNVATVGAVLPPYSVKLTIVLHPVFSAIIPAGN